MAGDTAVGIFNDALSMSLEERPEFLQRACRGDPHLVAEISSLLAVHDAALELPALEIGFAEVQPRTHLGTFLIHREIGRGGMGIVYLAEDPRLRRQLAIKTLPLRLGGDSHRLHRLEREAQVLASLNHPNIATLHALQESNGISYLVLELVEGRTLTEELRSGPMSISRALHLCRQIATALAGAHERGIVHRDLKPSNVMVTSDARVKLVDFGLAKVLSEADPVDSPNLAQGADSGLGTDSHGGSGDSSPTGSDARTERSVHSFTDAGPGGFFGTPGYMSPEQLRGTPVTCRADLWSFGCILYECLTGRPAFPGESVRDRIESTLRGEPDWTCIPSRLTESAQAILRSCLAAEPVQRPRSIGEVLQSLDDNGEHRGSSILEPIVVGDARRRSGSTRLGVALLGLIALATAGSVFLATQRPNEREGASPTFRQVSFEGDVLFFAVSPNGNQVAYSTWKQDLVVLDLSTGAETRRPLRCVSQLDWSPSGSEILATIPPYLGANDIQTVGIAADGGELRRIGPDGFVGMSWSSDGTRVAGLAARVSGSKSIAILDLVSGEITHLPGSMDIGRVENLKWSPAGDHLAAETFGQDTRTIWILDIDGGAPVPVAGDRVSWGPKGESLLVVSRRPAWEGITRIDFDPISGRQIGSQRRVCALQQAAGITLSRNGQRLLITRSLQLENLWQLDLTQGAEQRSWTRITAGTRDRQYPRISPDGTQVACIEAGPGGGYDLVVHDLVDSSRLPMTLSTAVAGNPAWAPDGSEVAIQRIESGERRVWTVGATDGQSHPLEGVSAAEHLTWAFGRGLLSQPPESRDQNFQIADPQSGESSMLFSEPTVGTAFQIRASPDGTHIAVAGNRGDIADVRTWIVDLADGSETLLVDLWAAPVGWSGDSDWVYVIGPTPDSREEWSRSVFRVPAGGGEAELIADLPGPVYRWGSVDVSQDGHTLICSVVEGHDDLWLVENLRIE